LLVLLKKRKAEIAKINLKVKIKSRKILPPLILEK
jgi:hypothetical protein